MFWILKISKKIFSFGIKTLFLIAALATWFISCGVGSPGIGTIGFVGFLFYVFVLLDGVRDWWIGLLWGTTKKGKAEKKKSKKTAKTKEEDEDDE